MKEYHYISDIMRDERFSKWILPGGHWLSVEYKDTWDDPVWVIAINDVYTTKMDFHFGRDRLDLIDTALAFMDDTYWFFGVDYE